MRGSHYLIPAFYLWHFLSLTPPLPPSSTHLLQPIGPQFECLHVPCLCQSLHLECSLFSGPSVQIQIRISFWCTEGKFSKSKAVLGMSPIRDIFLVVIQGHCQDTHP